MVNEINYKSRKHYQSQDFNYKTHYDDIILNCTKYANLKFIATAIIASAIEDADMEFLEDDYERWRKIFLMYKPKNKHYKEWELEREYKYKQSYKNMLFDIAEITVTTADVPQEILDERRLYENNEKETLVRLTGYQLDTLYNVSKMHGWRIGLFYSEPTIFDL